jgi:uncharacterized protein (DUF433 family)
MGLTETLAPKAPPLRVDEDGVLRVGGTRVTLDTVIGAFDEGATAEEIAMRYDALDLADIYTVIGYYLENQDEVEGYLNRRRQQADEVRREIETRSPQKGLRDRLLARRRSGG